MGDWKFGDMVYDTQSGGEYMIVGPYRGKRKAGDDKGPAVWIADISTEYMEIGEGGTVWIAVSRLEPVEDE